MKLGSILTVTKSPSANLARLPESAGSVFVTTNQLIPKVFGLFSVPTKSENPTLREVITAHMRRIRGKETIGICSPDLILPKDFSVLNNLMSNKMDMSWAFYSYATPNSTDPELFIITTGLLPYLLRDVKDDVIFDDSIHWRFWLKGWLKKIMQPHKLFDVSSQIKISLPAPVGLESLDNGSVRPHPDEYVPAPKAIKKKKRKIAKI